MLLLAHLQIDSPSAWAGQLEVVMQRVQLGGFFEYKLRCLLELSIWESTTVNYTRWCFCNARRDRLTSRFLEEKICHEWVDISPIDKKLRYFNCQLCKFTRLGRFHPKTNGWWCNVSIFASLFPPGEGHFQVNQPLVVFLALCIGSYQPSSRQELAMQNNDAYHEFCLFQTKPIGSIYGVYIYKYFYVYHTNQPFM